MKKLKPPIFDIVSFYKQLVNETLLELGLTDVRITVSPSRIADLQINGLQTLRTKYVEQVLQKLKSKLTSPHCVTVNKKKFILITFDQTFYDAFFTTYKNYNMKP